MIATKKVPETVNKDLTGLTIGGWQVVGFVGKGNDLGRSTNHSFWLCQCRRCGESVVMRSNAIGTKDLPSCKNHKPKTKHKLFSHWAAMVQRCEDENQRHYHRYGGRGIGVCDRWRRDFWSFVNDMGDRPDGYTLDRIDNEKGYSPENCRWASRSDQSKNRNSNRFISHDGKTMCVSDWARMLGVPPSTIVTRLNHAGWCEHCAVSKPRFGKCEHK